jgi:CubicO group peptidase (beta-lactamase class C family)
MRKIFVAVLFVLLLVVGVGTMLGITPRYVLATPSVASGIGAKLLCSARYVSNFSAQVAFDDLVQYSPALRYLSVDYDDATKTVTTSFFGLSTTTARYLPGLGCANEFDQVHGRDGFMPNQPARLASRWPHGNRVDTTEAPMQALLEEILAEDNQLGLNTRALLLVHKGQIVAEAYGQSSGPNTPLLGWSMAKSLMSVMLGNLVLRGKLDPQHRPLFTDWEGDTRRDIRLQDLLQMSDGLAFSEQYNPGDDATAMLFTEPSAAAYALEKPLLHPPGTHYNYSSGTANLLSKLYFDHTGATLQSTYDDYIENIFIPMSFQDAIFETDASGVFVGSSYLYASARDWARLGQLMLNGGEINGRRIISKEWVTQSSVANDTENNKAYGYQWWLNDGGSSLRWPDLPTDSFAAQGNRQQTLMVLPASEAVIVRLGWTSGNYPVNEHFARILGNL